MDGAIGRGEQPGGASSWGGGRLKQRVQHVLRGPLDGQARHCGGPARPCGPVVRRVPGVGAADHDGADGHLEHARRDLRHHGAGALADLGGADQDGDRFKRTEKTTRISA